MFWHKVPQAETFKSLGTPLYIEKGASIPIGEHVYFIEEGIAALTMLTPSGDEKTYLYFKEGNLLGFIRFTLPLEVFERSYLSINVNSIVAKTPLHLYAINNKTFFQELENNPLLYKDLSLSLTQNLSNVLEHSFWVASEDASTRLCLMLQNFMIEEDNKCVLPKCFTYREMSNFLSIHTVTIAKICKRLCDERIIERSGHRLFITNRERLKKIATREESLQY